VEETVEMTQAQREAIREALTRWTEEATVDRNAAREHLIREGFYDAEGNLSAQYGGSSEPESR
jgi:hypothetical protein